MSQYKLTIWTPNDYQFRWSHEFTGRFREFSPVKPFNSSSPFCRMTLSLYNKLRDYVGVDPFQLSSDWQLDRLDDNGEWHIIAWHFDRFNSCLFKDVWCWLYAPSTPVSHMRCPDLIHFASSLVSSGKEN